MPWSAVTCWGDQHQRLVHRAVGSARRDQARRPDPGCEASRCPASPARAGRGRRQRWSATTTGGLDQLPSAGATGPASWSLRNVDFADQLAGIPGIDTPQDPEPEYVSYSTDSATVALILQENNAIGWVDDHHLVTANEGDWKGGSRGWTIFDTRTGKPAWDAGNSYEHLAIANGLYPEHRSADKGTEPEGLAIAEIDGVRYGFVAAERANFVAVYDLTDPVAPVYRQSLPTTNGPEGLLPIPSRGLLAVSSETDELDNRVRASVSLFQLGQQRPAFPTIHSTGEHPDPWARSVPSAATSTTRTGCTR